MNNLKAILISALIVSALSIPGVALPTNAFALSPAVTTEIPDNFILRAIALDPSENDNEAVLRLQAENFGSAEVKFDYSGSKKTTDGSAALPTSSFKNGDRLNLGSLQSFTEATVQLTAVSGAATVQRTFFIDKTISPTAALATTTPDGKNGLTIYFKKPTNWGSPALYYYSPQPATVPTVTWGTSPAMKPVSGQDGWFVHTIANAKSATVMFKDDGGNQIPGVMKPGFLQTDTNWFDGTKWTETSPFGATPVKYELDIKMTAESVKAADVENPEAKPDSKPVATVESKSTVAVDTAPNPAPAPTVSQKPKKPTTVAKVTKKPAAPRNVFTKKNRDNSIFVGWSPGVGTVKAVRYTVYRNNTFVANVLNGKTSVTLKDADYSNSNYMVKAVAADGTLSNASKPSTLAKK